jgi:hypothetical protein
MKPQHVKTIHHSILKRKIALEEAEMLFESIGTDLDQFVKIQVFHPDGKSKLIRIPAVSAYAVIRSGVSHVNNELQEFESSYVEPLIGRYLNEDKTESHD